MNVLVVGFGNMGRNHARVLRDLGHDVQTLDPADVGADHRMLSFEVISWADTVCIATPIDELARHAEAWIRRGKDVLVEKPGATDAATLAYLHDLAKQQGVRLSVGYTERHNPAVAVLADCLPGIGTLRHITIRRLGYSDSTTDPTLNLACHDLDVLYALAFGYVAVESTLTCEGHISAALRGHYLEDKVTISLEASHLHPTKTRYLEAVGSEGVLRLDYQLRSVVRFDPEGDAQAVHVPTTEPLVREWEAFFDGDTTDGLAPLALVEELQADASRLAVV